MLFHDGLQCANERRRDRGSAIVPEDVNERPAIQRTLYAANSSRTTIRSSDASA